VEKNQFTPLGSHATENGRTFVSKYADVKLIFNKAESFFRKGQSKAKQLHSRLLEQAKYCMQQIPSDAPTD